MAIDTREKRASAASMLMPWLPMLPVPDGVIDAADRVQVIGLYSGFAIGSTPVFQNFGGSFLYTAANWNISAWNLESYMRSVSGEVQSRLYDVTADLAISDSLVTTSSTDYARLRSSDITLIDGHEYIAQFAGSGSSGVFRSSKLIGL